MRDLPDSAIVEVAPVVAEQILSAGNRLPHFENKDYYDQKLQNDVYQQVRHGSGGALESVVQEMRTALATPPFIVVVKGVSFDNEHRVLVALNRAFGALVARPFDAATPRAQLIHHVQPQEDIVNHRAKWDQLQKLSEKLHIDGADRPLPLKYVSMRCVQHDSFGGGRSWVLDSHGFRATIAAVDSHAIALLEGNDVPWQIVDYLGGGVTWRPVLRQDKVSWRHYTIETAINAGQNQLPPPLAQLIDQIDGILASNQEYIYEFSLQPDEFLMLDNQRCLHARSPIIGINTERLMLRAWIQ